MGKKVFLTILTVIFVLIFAGMIMAASKGNSRKGKYLYRKTCRACHSEGAKRDKAGQPLSPIDKSQAEWTKVFDENDKLTCKKDWGKLSDRDLKDIFTYLHGHASDSPNPAKCK
ncbi:MAG: cytochrome c [Desulfobacteraceae bacterium]|nr:cytochrome c [Desulfobacteraceae bacterium]